jgi:class 3 adenylate cyclase
VTVLFTDISGFTLLTASVDAERLGRVMNRYFGEMRTVIERHGGRVEKFIGDAIMAVFGFPRLHEDDALRAVRAVIDMRDTLDGLNVELERYWGVALKVHAGINTGEVAAEESPVSARC